MQGKTATRGKRSDASREKKIAVLVNERERHHGRDAAIGSIVHAWREANKVSLSVLEKSEPLSRFLQQPPAGDLKECLLSELDSLSLKDVEVAFENIIEATRKRAEGVVYTPNYVIDYLVKECETMRRGRGLPRLLDPACGGGGFLVRAAPILATLHNASLERVVSESLHGIDISGDAIECAKISLALFCAERRVPLNSAANVFRVDDSLLSPIEKICTEFDIPSGGFDLITTNPPYVKLQNLDEPYRAKLIAAYPDFTVGSFSLAMLFLIAGHRMLNPDGQLGFITQNNLFTSLAGVGVRQYLQHQQCLRKIINFEHFKVFNNASAYTCLIFLDKKPRELFDYTSCCDPKDQLPMLEKGQFSQIALGSLRKEKWRMTEPRHLENVAKLETRGIPLGSLAEIRVGFATLKDSVFLLNGRADQENIEEGITAPAIKIAEFSDQSELGNNERRVIRPYRLVGKRWIPLEPAEMKDRFPNAYKYLERHRELLETRNKGKANPRNFYEWGRTQGMDALGPKLLTKTFSKGPQFLLDSTNSLFCNGYSVRPRSTDDLFGQSLDIQLLQRILNSSVMDYYTRLTAFQIEGGYQCFQKNFIERFCIPPISEADSRLVMSTEGEERDEIICRIFDVSFGDIHGITAPSGR